MARIFFLLSILMALWVLPSYAMPLSEMSQSDLRKAVGAGKSISVKTALKGLSRSVPGEPVDVRAFEGDGVYYRVLLMQASGVVVSVVLDAETGAVLPTSSEAARSVNASAKSGHERKGSRSRCIRKPRIARQGECRQQRGWQWQRQFRWQRWRQFRRQWRRKLRRQWRRQLPAAMAAEIPAATVAAMPVATAAAMQAGMAAEWQRQRRQRQFRWQRQRKWEKLGGRPYRCSRPGVQRTLRILLAEDEIALCDQIKRVLGLEGRVVDVVHDGEEAAFLGATEPYDMVILDIGLPKRDGIFDPEGLAAAERLGAGPAAHGTRRLVRPCRRP